MEAKTIQRYSKRSIPWLRKKAGFYFRKYIRLRDQHKGCVSCPSTKVEHASHFYSGGHYPPLEFNENNVHGSCVRCNTFLSGNLNEYRKRITQRITEDDLKELDLQTDLYKRNGYKHDRFYLIEVIETYKLKCKRND